MSSGLINQLLTPLIFSVFTFGFSIIWYNYRRFKSAGYFAVSYLLAAFAFAFEALVIESSAANFVAWIGDLFYILGPVIFAFAVYELYNVKPPKFSLLSLLIGLFAAASWFRFVDPSLEGRTQIITIGNGVIMLLGAMAIKSIEKRPIDQLILCILILFGLQFFVNTYASLYVIDEELTPTNFSTSVFFAVTNLVVSVLALSLAVALFVKYGMQIISSLHGQTRMDELSGLLNRRGFEHEMHAALNQPEIPNERNALIVCDLDHFKKVNDQFGHELGDAVIMAFAHLLISNARKGDLIGRIGGEEFCIFIPGANDSEAAEIAECIRHAFSKVSIEGIPPDYKLTASFGVAHCRGAKSETLFRRADAAMYRAKQLGRDRVEADSARTEVTRLAN